MPLGTVKSINVVTGIIVITPDQDKKELFVYDPAIHWPLSFAIGQKIRFDAPLSPSGRLARNIQILTAPYWNNG